MKKILTISLLLCLLLPAFFGCTKPEEEMYCAKPVIYLYPQTDKDVTVLLDYNGDLTCTYPEYQNDWQVTAAPDGTLTTPDGKQYNYLYWEGENHFTADFSQGFVVKGEETASFLEEALSQLGLTPREANEFIVYWLPQMQNSPYNLISFQQEAYTQNAILSVSPQPDTVIRVNMAWKPLEKPIPIEKQTLSAPERTGFTLVEWGGVRILE